jgi:uncharacterized membrane protein YhaH (DUF805 family)
MKTAMLDLYRANRTEFWTGLALVMVIVALVPFVAAALP